MGLCTMVEKLSCSEMKYPIEETAKKLCKMALGIIPICKFKYKTPVGFTKALNSVKSTFDFSITQCC